MTDQLCIVIHKHEPERARMAVEGTYLCVGHGRRLTEQIRSLPEVRDELTVALARAWGETVTDDTTRLAIAEKPLPLQPDIADLRSEMESRLMSYARMVAEEMDTAWPPTGLENVAPWLVDRMDVAAAQLWIEDMAEGVDELIRQARGALDSVKWRAIYLGRCEGGGDCEAPLYARVRTGEGSVEDSLPAGIICDICETKHDVNARILILQQALEGVGTAKHLSRLVGTPVGSIRSWASRGQLKRVARDEQGRPMYRVEDVRACVDRQEEQAVQRCG